MKIVAYILAIALLASACDDTDLSSAEIVVYEGPMRTVDNAVIIHSDSAVIKAKVKAATITDLQNGDREVKKGMFIEFFDKEGTRTATLESDYAYYTAEIDKWKAQGNVVITNIQNKETMRTEELFWEPKTEDISTEKFVQIEQPGQVMTGTGLKAKQDFSTWELLNPEGIFDLEDESEL